MVLSRACHFYAENCPNMSLFIQDKRQRPYEPYLVRPPPHYLYDFVFTAHPMFTLHWSPCCSSSFLVLLLSAPLLCFECFSPRHLHGSLPYFFWILKSPRWILSWWSHHHLHPHRHFLSSFPSECFSLEYLSLSGILRIYLFHLLSPRTTMFIFCALIYP